jgi:hypothetical protein
LSSLNQFISNINHETWRKSGTNTNNAEAAHSMVNREGKQLKLLSAILRLVIYIYLIFLLYIIFKNIYYFIEGKNMMNGVTKQLKFITIRVFLIHIGIKVKLSEQVNQ